MISNPLLSCMLHKDAIELIFFHTREHSVNNFFYNFLISTIPIVVSGRKIIIKISNIYEPLLNNTK